MSAINEHMPPGFHFDPTDEELVNGFLKKKVMNEKMPYIIKIEEVNVYRDGPQLLTETHRALGVKVWYFFTPRNQKHQNGGRPSRLTEDGYWKATSGEKKVRHNGEIVGFKQVLVFYQGKHGKAEKTNWIMHEYKVKRTAEVKFDDMVLCRIYKREVGSSKDKEKEVADNRECIEPFPVTTENNNLESGDRTTEPFPVIVNNNLQGRDLTEPVQVIGDNDLQGMTDYNNNGVTNWLEDYEINNFDHALYGRDQNNQVSTAENTSNHENSNLESRICNNGVTNSLQDYVPEFNNFGHLPYGGENNPVFAAENTFNNEIITLEGRICNNVVTNSLQDYVPEFNNFTYLPYEEENNQVFAGENTFNNEIINLEGMICNNLVTNSLEDYIPEFNNFGHLPYGGENNPVFAAENTFNNEIITLEGRICNNGVTNSLQDYVPEFNNLTYLPYGEENNPIFAAENTFNNEIINFEGRICNNHVTNWLEDYVPEFNNFGPLPYEEENNPVFAVESTSRSNNCNVDVCNEFNNSTVGGEDYPVCPAQVFSVEATSTSNNLDLYQEDSEIPKFIEENLSFDVGSDDNNLC